MPRRDPRNTTRFWVNPRFPGLSLMRAEFTTHEFPPHVHEAFVVAATEAGGSVVKSRGLIEQAHQDALFVFNPGEPHAGWMGRSSLWRYRAFYLARPAIEWLAGELGIEQVPHFTRNMFTDRDLIDAFLRLHAACERASTHDPRELMVSTFGTLFGRHGSGGGRIAPAPADRELVRRAMDIMHARFAEPLLLDDLAAALHLTSFQLIGLFKRTMSLTPHAYLTQIRLNAACRLLKRNCAPAEVAAACGFYDQSAMNKHFKRCYAITPLQYARANLEARAQPA
ncbi:MAG TPA: AraC family transcriptional regulator [Hyphomicrobiaceae bacterium]|nr:AraC family transcriptional regulator [Hyphomicrobiaceae bacterium]